MKKNTHTQVRARESENERSKKKRKKKKIIEKNKIILLSHVTCMYFHDFRINKNKYDLKIRH